MVVSIDGDVTLPECQLRNCCLSSANTVESTTHKSLTLLNTPKMTHHSALRKVWDPAFSSKALKVGIGVLCQGQEHYIYPAQTKGLRRCHSRLCKSHSHCRQWEQRGHHWLGKVLLLVWLRCHGCSRMGYWLWNGEIPKNVSCDSCEFANGTQESSLKRKKILTTKSEKYRLWRNSWQWFRHLAIYPTCYIQWLDCRIRSQLCEFTIYISLRGIESQVFRKEFLFCFV